jgi:hypothetical protein
MIEEREGEGSERAKGRGGEGSERAKGEDAKSFNGRSKIKPPYGLLSDI